MPTIDKITINGASFYVHAPDGFTINTQGVFTTGSDAEPIKISSLVWVDSIIYYPHSGEYTMLIKGMNTMSGGLFELSSSRANLFQAYPNPLPTELYNRGADIEQGHIKSFLGYLAQQRNVPTNTGVIKIGWHNDTVSALKAFVLPQRVIGPNDLNLKYLPESDSPTQDSMKAKGSLDEWKENIASKTKGNPILQFAIGVSFSAPLLELVGLDAGGCHFYATSSRGKTLTLQVAASPWGDATDPGATSKGCYIQRWSTTGNAIESTAMAFNDLLLPFDELGTNTERQFGSSIYNITGCTGKARATRTGGAVTKRQWLNYSMSSGEISIAQKIKETSGKDAHTGQQIRFMDIPVEDNILVNTGDLSPAVFGSTLKDSCSSYYGTAGIPYLEHVVPIANDPIKLREINNCYIDVTSRLQSDDMKPEQARAMKRFAIVYVALLEAAKIGLLECSEEEAFSTVSGIAKTWLDSLDVLSDIDKGIDNICNYIRKYPRRFRDLDHELDAQNNIVGYKDNRNNRYHIIKSDFEEVCGRSNIREIVKKLDKLGLLHKNNTDSNGNYRLISKLRVSGAGLVTGYSISFRILDDEDTIESSEPDSSNIVSLAPYKGFLNR